MPAKSFVRPVARSMLRPGNGPVFVEREQMRTQRTTIDTGATAVIDYDRDRDLLIPERTHQAFTVEKLLTMISRRASPLRVGKSPLGYLASRVWVTCCRVAGSAVDVLSNGVAERSAQPLSFDWRMP